MKILWASVVVTWLKNPYNDIEDINHDQDMIDDMMKTNLSLVCLGSEMKK